MGYSRLIVEKGEDHVATVTLNRPEKMNAFDSPLAENSSPPSRSSIAVP